MLVTKLYFLCAMFRMHKKTRKLRISSGSRVSHLTHLAMAGVEGQGRTPHTYVKNFFKMSCLGVVCNVEDIISI